MRKSLFTLALLLIALPVWAGSLKVHEWQTTVIPQDITTIDVLVDVGFYIIVYNQASITLTQDSGSNNYSAIYSSPVFANFDAHLSVTCTPSGDVDIAELTAEIVGSPYIPAHTTEIFKVSLAAQGVAIENLVGGTIGQKIADLTITVNPGSAPELEE